MLITAKQQLNRDVLIAECRRHETVFMAKAVCQCGHMMMLTFNDRTFKHFVEEGATLQESLLLKLSSVGVAVSTSTSTAGINCQVHHTGTFTDAASVPTQAKNKATVRMAGAMVRLLRHFCFSNLSFHV